MSYDLPDVQSSKDGFHNIPIQKVGVRNIKVPFRLNIKDSDKTFNTIANISSYCNLVSDIKGINMSRISRTINEVLGRDNKDGFSNLNDFVYELQKNHGTNNIFIKANFDYIIKSSSPLTLMESQEPYNITFETHLNDNIIKNYITVKSYEMSLCPCSREMSLLINNITADERYDIESLPNKLRDKILMSGFGAHNQKSEIEVKVLVNSDSLIWIEDIIDIIKKGASSPTFSTLKRLDEKYLTETSYAGGYFNEKFEFVKVEGTGAKFVEDISRDISYNLNLLLDKTISDYVVVVNNHESIHSDEIIATAVINANRILN